MDSIEFGFQFLVFDYDKKVKKRRETSYKDLIVIKTRIWQITKFGKWNGGIKFWFKNLVGLVSGDTIVYPFL